MIPPNILRTGGVVLCLLLMGTALAQTPPQEGNPPPMMTVPRTGASVPPPRTDAEAQVLLDHHDPLLTRITRGLYRAYRAQGDDVLTAYTKTLAAVMQAYRANHPDRE